MERLNLEDFKKKYYPDIPQSQLAKMMDITDCEYTKIKTQQYSQTTSAFKKAYDFMWYNHKVKLTYDSIEYKLEKKYHNQILNLEMKLRQKDQEITALKNELSFHEEVNKVIRYIKNKL